LLDYNLLKEKLNTKDLGRAFIQFESLQSSSQKAKSISNQSPHGMIVFAEEQWNAKIKKNKMWYAPKGGIYFSLIIKNNDEENLSTLYNLILMKAIKQSVSNLCKNIELRLPNDIFAGNKKIGCTNVERIIRAKDISYIMDVFINADISKKDLEENLEIEAISLKEITDKKIIRENIIADILNEVELIINEYLDVGEIQKLLNENLGDFFQYKYKLQIRKMGNKKWNDAKIKEFDPFGNIIVIKEGNIEVLDLNKNEMKVFRE
jgi:BirA family biotin operon repressor/biotin-[acetyl-CoA-carboxylase] ligase